mgnify:CR=1 FL=1
MEQEVAMGMLENLGTLRKLLADYDREMQRLKIENEWLKKVLEDCEKKRVDAKGRYIIDMMKPQPCTRFCDAPAMAWIAKLVEETHEVIQEATFLKEDADEDGMVDHDTYGLIDVKKRLAMELTDVITVCTSWLDALGYDEAERGRIQQVVNDKNHKREYW